MLKCYSSYKYVQAPWRANLYINNILTYTLGMEWPFHSSSCISSYYKTSYSRTWTLNMYHLPGSGWLRVWEEPDPPGVGYSSPSVTGGLVATQGLPTPSAAPVRGLPDSSGASPGFSLCRPCMPCHPAPYHCQI